MTRYWVLGISTVSIITCLVQGNLTAAAVAAALSAGGLVVATICDYNISELNYNHNR